MNERIRKLAEQATTIEHGARFDRVTFNKEKFAQLIVEECLSLLDKHYDASVASNDIKEHFGVKE
jgi:hypothetical protein